MLLIVGLGNPGTKYKNTYHNVGFGIVDELAKRLKVKFAKKECQSVVATCKRGGQDVVLAKPQTYMNLSGEAVEKLVKKYVDDLPTQLIVCYDDADLPIGKVRLRKEGSAGTHNGMKSVVAHLGTTTITRVRVGIKTQELASGSVLLLDMVLSKPNPQQREQLNEAINKVCDQLMSLIDGEEFYRVEANLNKRD